MIPTLMLLAPGALGAPVEVPAASEPLDATFSPARSLAPLIESVQPAVVTIEVQGNHDLSAVPPHVLEMFGFDPEDVPSQAGEGSGFIIDDTGLLLTNHHVIADAESIKVTLHDGTEVMAKPVGSDASLDVALLQLQGDRDWPAVPLGSSADLRVGDWVVALGNGLGLGTTATAGIVSGKGRVIGHDVFGQESFVQTDAAINQGNSGGPLFSLDGEVVGMNTAIIAGANTVGFAIPSDLIRSIVDDLKIHGRVSRGFLGVKPQTLNDDLRRALDVEAAQGAVLANVFPDTPAATAGLRTGDVVLQVDGDSITSDSDLVSAIAGKRPGDRVALQIERDSKLQTLKVELAERPGDGRTSEEEPNEQPRLRTLSSLGLNLTSLTPALAADAGVRKGVLVERVDRDSPADGRLKPGDIVVEVNRRAVGTPDDVERQLARTSGSAFLLVIRDDAQQFVAMPLP